MINNDVLRSIRYMLDLGDAHIVAIVLLAAPDPAAAPLVDLDAVRAYLKREDEDGYVACPDRVLAHVLDGLVVHLRGRDPSLPPRRVETRVNNNVVLKKLRVAFALKDVDMHAVFAAAGYPIGKPELTALFRQAGHKHFRACGDQILRNFLKGLTIRLRGTE